MASKYTEEDEQALREFLIDEECLDELLPWTGKFNIFDVLKISRTEIRHSNMISWLLDPNENHGIGDKYIKFLFQFIVNNNAKHSVFDLLLLDYYSFSVYREWKNIDLLLVSNEEKVLVAIENKVGSHEHSNQLNRYRSILENEYDNYNRIYLYLTPDGDAPSDSENWEILTYQDLVDGLENIMSKVELLPDVELMIRNYIDIVRRDIVEDQELVDICNKIYTKHKRALDLIYENKTDNRTVITDSVIDILKRYEEQGLLQIEYSTISNTVITFTTTEMDMYLPPDEKYLNSWGTHTIYKYYIHTRHYPEIISRFEIGGSGFNEQVSEAVDKITHILKPNDNREIFKYKRLYSTKKYTIDEDNFDESCQKVIDSMVREILNMQTDVLNKL